MGKKSRETGGRCVKQPNKKEVVVVPVANASFSIMIWERIPNIHYDESTTYAIANFNNGRKATWDIFRLLKVDPGYYKAKICINSNGKSKSLSINEVIQDRKGEKWTMHRKKQKQQQDNHMYREGAYTTLEVSR